MKALFRLYNTFNNKDFGIYYTEDLEQTQKDFEQGWRPRFFKKYKYSSNISMEIVETNENAIIKTYSQFKYPQDTRVEYEDSAVNRVIEKRYSSRVRKAVYCLTTTYPQQNYSFKIADNGNGYVVGLVYCDAVLSEEYEFMHRGIPRKRTILN